MQWLSEMAKSGVVEPASDYLVNTLGEMIDGGGDMNVDVGYQEPVVDIKGKGKERDADAMMFDITNSKSFSLEIITKTSTFLQVRTINLASPGLYQRAA